MSARKEIDEGLLTPPAGATAIDLWAPGHFSQIKWLAVISGV